MIVLKSKTYSFRDRAPEWILSFGLLIWGLVLLTTPELFNSAKIYSPFLTIMSQFMWGASISLIGGFRLLALIVNGLWRPTAHLRAVGAAFGTVIWGSLLSITLLNSAARGIGISIFSMLLAFEFMALWWAAGDAKLVDSAAKSKKENNGT